MVETDDFCVSIVRYKPNSQQPTHFDPLSRVSFVIFGAYAEDSPRGAITAHTGDVLFKSKLVPHKTRFGGCGALIAALAFKSERALSGIHEEIWSQQRNRNTTLSFLALLEAALAGKTNTVVVAAADLISSHESPDRKRSEPRGWLTALKNDLEVASLAQINVTDRATTAGVHPVHASRAFRHNFGVSISEFAQFHAVRRAMNMFLHEGKSLSDIAVAAGFYDQSHMNRAFSRVLHRAPKLIRSLFKSARTNTLRSYKTATEQPVRL